MYPSKFDIVVKLIKENTPENAAKKIMGLFPACSHSDSSYTGKVLQDYEFNMHKRWKDDEPNKEEDDGNIKHFKD